MAKYENPIRGYLSCPVCQSIATTHQVGEGQLIATGEPPKNNRNIGLMYYRCPECGNSSNSKKVTEYIHAHSVAELTELKPNLTEKSSVTPPVLVTEPNRAVTEDAPMHEPVLAVKPTERLTESVQTDEVSHDAASNREVTELESNNETTKQPFPFKRVLIGLASVIFLLWAVSQPLPKPKAEAEPLQGGEHGAS